MHSLIKSGLLLLSILTSLGISIAQAADRLPNFVIIFIDDMGFADIGPFGSTLNRTPNLDRMAGEGMRLTSFYAAPLCTQSRAALMTGSYPIRVGLMHGTWHPVLMPGDEHGLNPDEVTIAEILKERGYITACVGKWHLGDQPPFLPTRHGFHYHYGIPYSNDMNPENNGKERNFPPLPLLRGEKVIGEITDQSTITEDLTREALQFIRTNREKPFFLYMPHVMVHHPLHAGKQFKGKSGNGILGDAIEEIDWSVGEILKTLKQLQLDENTLVLFTSDNGPAAGIATPLRGKKGSTFEGGMREPCVVRWPGRVEAGSTCDEITSTMDLLPTLARLAGTAAPSDRAIDGHDIWPLLSGQLGAQSSYRAFFYYSRNNLQAVRSGTWKLHLLGDKGKPALYNLRNDIGEASNLIEKHPQVASHLMALLEAARNDLGDGTERIGKNVRQVGYFKKPKQLIPNPNGQPVGRGDLMVDLAMWAKRREVN